MAAFTLRGRLRLPLVAALDPSRLPVGGEVTVRWEQAANGRMTLDIEPFEIEGVIVGAAADDFEPLEVAVPYVARWPWFDDRDAAWAWLTFRALQDDARGTGDTQWSWLAEPDPSNVAY